MLLENFGIKDIIDVVLVAIIMYQLYKLVSKSGASAAIFNGILAFFVLWILVSQVLEMRLLGSILDKFVSIGLLALIIIFQDEIRRFLMSLGTHSTIKAIMKIFVGRQYSSELSENITAPLIQACINMAKSKTGALIVIQQEIKLDNYEETGEIINADISTRLIENIFFKNSPLHDGAMIIADERIKSAGCILPVAKNNDLPKFLGLRHRAAVGITQQTDAKVIIISEERGKISYASGGDIQVNISPEKLQELLKESIYRKNKKTKGPVK